VAAASRSIDGVIVGRALRGGGAVGSAILALVADLTAEENRTKAMALVGITIGASFMVALVGIAIVQFVVPRPLSLRVHRDAETVPAMLGSVLRNRELLRLDFGIFALHAMLTASFLIVPSVLHARLGVSVASQWLVYLPVLLASVVLMVPAIIVAERYRCMKAVFIATVAVLAVSQWLLAFDRADSVLLVTALVLFFAGFNVMEASLPSLITKISPSTAKGTAAGLYSSFQFRGIFVGGVAGGWMQQRAGATAVFLWACALALLWALLAVTMRPPGYLVTRMLRIGRRADAGQLAAALRCLPGVAEVVVPSGEEIAYLKIASKVFDPASAQALVGAP
jgi:predicted MFS family arabinose efflux permease